MIRRPATVISLNDEELQCHLQRAFLRTLPADFNTLHLGDGDQSEDGHTFAGSSSGDSRALSDFDGEFDFTTMPYSTGGSSCLGNNSSSAETRFLTAPNAFSVAAMTASLHQPPEPNRSPATTNQISTHFPRYRTCRSRDSPSAKVMFTILRHALEPYSMGSGETKKQENRRRAQVEVPGHDARLSASQVFRLSPDSYSALTISSVPLRGLSLASTESYEAVLANTSSVHVALDATWKSGAVQSDSILETSNAE